VMAEGAIYRDVLTDDVFYDDLTRPIGLTQRNGHADHWISVDAGTANAQVYLDVYDDGTVLWCDREYYWDSRAQGRQKTNGEYASDLELFMGPDRNAWPSAIIVDPAAASFKVELLTRGMNVIDANNEVIEGIRRVSAMLGNRKLRINRQRCPNLVREMQTYAWDEKKTDKGTDQPLKKHDHSCDSIRYGISTKINDWRIAA
jgi:phage terminase large subunit